MDVTPTTAMTNIITEIMVEVLKIFGIVMKEIRRGSASEFRIGRVRIFTELCVVRARKCMGENRVAKSSGQIR